MTKGRPADPTRTRRQTGNRPKPNEARVSKVADRVAEVVAAIPAPRGAFDPPADLLPEAQDMYRRVLEELLPRGLREADLEAVAMMCHSASVHYAARRKIAEQGLLVEGPRGPLVNPLIKVARDEANTYLRLANEFGLTLAARLRLGLMQLAGESIVSSLNADLDAQAAAVVIEVK